MDVVEGGRPAARARARGDGADLGTVEMEFDSTGQRPRGRWTGDQADRVTTAISPQRSAVMGATSSRRRPSCAVRACGPAPGLVRLLAAVLRRRR